ncbi:FRG domain-containing protein [Priestia aryabhattai]|uniref:FRG domain-containing protein n=1 Tax=Priestia aryabhattai TaxID=412384 RepID=UPI001CD5123B|nr:FRG domain-containing protein [Priestia aryabhattai]MCA1050989.1 FRG domain-containing protein [Priestia aryabhattai]
MSMIQEELGVKIPLKGNEDKEDSNTVYKLSDFMRFIEKLPEDFSLSRGQSGNYPLLPSALRKDKNGNKKYSRPSIAYFLNQFKIHSYQYMENPTDIKNEHEWMIYAQHYGIPTKLLDFTNSHIISLLFAVEKAFDEEEPSDAVVWFLNPQKLNLKHCETTKILMLSEKKEIKLDDYDGPVVVQGRKLHSRVNSQNGLFVYFQDTETSLEEKIEDEEILRKVVIHKDAKKSILASLYTMGVGFTQIYPELPSVGRDILMKNNINQYMEYLKESEELV